LAADGQYEESLQDKLLEKYHKTLWLDYVYNRAKVFRFARIPLFFNGPFAL
jgi:ribosomal protein S17E